MQDFQFYVTDGRYTVPTVAFVRAKDAIRARMIAHRMVGLAHHEGIDVWRDDRLLFRLRKSGPGTIVGQDAQPAI